MAIGVHNGYDLTTSAGFRKAPALVRETKPRYMHFSPPCGPWSSMQNMRRQVQVLAEERQISRKLLKNCCKLMQIQRQEGQAEAGLAQAEEASRHAGGEQPIRASSWKLPEFREMLRLCGATRFQVLGCAHGLRNPQNGRRWYKPWGWFSSLPVIRQALELPCTHQACDHETIQGGRRCAISATYPLALCRRFAKALMKTLYQGEVRTPWRSSLILAGESEAVADPMDREVNPEAEDALMGPDIGNPEGDPKDSEQGPPSNEDDDFQWDPEIKRKLTLVHRNLGHPSHPVLLKLLRDAGASQEVLRQAEHFQCNICKQRGRRAPVRPATVPHYNQK